MSTMASGNGDMTFMEKAAIKWAHLGHFFGHRPAQVLGVITGGLILIVLLAYSSINTANNTTHLNDIRSAFCNGGASYTAVQERNCRRLMDQLLRNPTPEQVKRLRELVKETP